ncbi:MULTISPECIES: sodium:alanine symporter family protein [Cycloclasticus]|uniref:Alanine symporter-like amino acid transport protein n=1 Tax=Cycloclasticus pugetii TaxID=34068 RepID=A0AB33Z4X8_9GAMM|nr:MULTISPECIES: sodium:alanine symporter family protein [Cycloclasticus]ATI03835.1 sodium:alanine symporter family protein [Cycloclasticus sp. PY97N]EPD14268.1 alanine symporter-like amino acid transport protein [Cycloclasticus pugetii]
METLTQLLSSMSSFVWGPVILALLLGTGLYLMLGLLFLPIRQLPAAFSLLWRGRVSNQSEAGEISPFNALMTSLAATIGTGNIAGVATAIFLGGPGAVFWMWLTALVGMATKYAEAVLAVKYREVDERGAYVGGPMYYIKNGLAEQWHWLGFLFSLLGAVAAFGIGNTIQANSVADALSSTLGVPAWQTGLVMGVVVYIVLVGGIKRIGHVASKLVPMMGIAYLTAAGIIIIQHLDAVPKALQLIVNDAFTGTAAVGGFAGAGLMAAIRFGVARGVFSNEAGLGTAPIAHAAAQTNNPVRQGKIAMLGTFIDTIIICTMTALVIILTGSWSSGETGASLSAYAFKMGLPGYGEYVVSFGLAVFALTTLLGWSYYGERCAEYILGVAVIPWYRIAWVLAVPLGAVMELDFLWLLADVLNGLMAIPNLIALLLLSPVVFKLSRKP